jgi:hypothetical protein
MREREGRHHAVDEGVGHGQGARLRHRRPAPAGRIGAQHPVAEIERQRPSTGAANGAAGRARAGPDVEDRPAF